MWNPVKELKAGRDVVVAVIDTGVESGEGIESHHLLDLSTRPELRWNPVKELKDS